jgi:hypothetical protein
MWHQFMKERSLSSAVFALLDLQERQFECTHT